jgi:CRP-like cAMP-binding protein
VSFFFFLAGVGAVRTTNPETIEELELARLKGGEFFGEVSLVKNKPRTATIVALGPTEVLELSRKDFQDIAHRHPEIGAALEKTIEQRVEDTIKKMLERMEK